MNKHNEQIKQFVPKHWFGVDPKDPYNQYFVCIEHDSPEYRAFSHEAIVMADGVICCEHCGRFMQEIDKDGNLLYTLDEEDERQVRIDKAKDAMLTMLLHGVPDKLADEVLEYLVDHNQDEKSEIISHMMHYQAGL